ncbi:GspE/PulE family protein [Tautonia plasticadhaerens]|uniref:Type II secretion system protein E n=1 Tax=Tautonia plasticadhaerens TaxID=2527974 RepID=A0A518HFQ5_9BACT|nr:GspE/PulE family protein [Tautonia plasticadhaerens]QDV39674.1 Type II secretion system protein E [Tautonia plasticadhaerens]
MNATVADDRALLIELLMQRGVLTPEGLREVRVRGGEVTERALIAAGVVADVDVARAYADYLGVPLHDPGPEVPAPDPELARLLTEKLCRDQMIAPVATRGDQLDLAFITPREMLVIDEVQLLTGLRVRPLIAPLSVVEQLIEDLFRSTRSAAAFSPDAESFEQADLDGDLAEEEDRAGTLVLDEAPPPGRDGRVIRMVNQILEHSIRSGASDIHFEPFEDACKIRMRVDGSLQEYQVLNRQVFITIVSRLKILGRMDIAEKRVPQDGAIALKSGDRRIDLRVNTMPTVYGEKMVIRLLDKTAIPLDLKGLGLSPRQAADITEAIRQPHGLILVTGPTGSGKSTTLYTCLNLLNEPTTNICTAEDPVEYKFKGLNQVQMKPLINLTFATALRAFLRQDPDIIMVGEVRDPETAQICMRAALTGHLVLSTLHTNDALSSISRLQDMELEPFMLASTLRLLQAQRLVRRLCPSCKAPYECDPETARRYGLEPGQPLYRPVGCDQCRGAGYFGRIGVFEVIRVTPGLADLIQARTALPELRSYVRSQGVDLLVHDAVEKARRGMTSLEAALSVAMAGDE